MTLDFSAITAFSADKQLITLADLQEENDSGFAELKERTDYKKMLDASDIDEQMSAYGALSDETRQILQDLSSQAKEIKQLRFHLYTESPHEEVRTEMQQVVDACIARHFSEDSIVGGKREISYYHDLLHLSTFGGKMTSARPDAYHLAYEFNAQNNEGYQPAVPWNPMENLFESGMTQVYSEETHGNNLTPAGKAVLARLNERFGVPKEAQTFTQKAGGQEQSLTPDS